MTGGIGADGAASARTLTIGTQTLALATLTCCLDGADAIMVAALKGVDGDAAALLRLIVDARPREVQGSRAGAARRALDDVFAVGLARWGRQRTTRAMQAFHTALAGWHRRLARLESLDPVDLERRLTAHGTQWIIDPSSPFWPTQLADLSIRKDWAPPLCLWGVGDPAALTSCSKPVAVVGSRGVNEYGRALARGFGERAALAGHLVVSGGAMGADAAAHWGALAAMDRSPDRTAVGRTVAVFAGGLDLAGPQCNRRMFEAIVEHGGALVSELPPGTVPEGRRFLLRNRIIAALASTVVVTQARLRSGALNTANWAAELNREVYAAPGDAGTPHNAGCNRLIHDNRAILLLSASAEGVCHPAHAPVLPAVPSPVPSESCGDSDAERDGGDAMCRSVAAALRRCRRDRVAASVTAVAERMDGVPSIGRALALLGRLEADGLVTVADGVVSVQSKGGKEGKAGSRVVGSYECR